jgi:hypothetical protein
VLTFTGSERSRVRVAESKAATLVATGSRHDSVGQLFAFLAQSMGLTLWDQHDQGCGRICCGRVAC